MSMYGAYDECRTDCLCHDCINRRRFDYIKGFIADCRDCDGVDNEDITTDPKDPWKVTIGYRSKKTGCELYEKRIGDDGGERLYN